jgi:major type 1 subunit fimbrin (pilin)
MKKILLATSLALAMGLGASSVMADDGTVTINGLVVASACTVAPGSKSITVPLPTITPATLTAQGDIAGRTKFDINLTNCTKGSLTNVLTSFSGTFDLDSQNVLKNTSTATDVAANVGVRLLERDGTTKIDINAGSNGEIETPILDGDMTLPFFAAYEKTNSTDITIGEVQSVATFTIGYN